ncbi:MAG: hypothetical protein HY903_14470 [Deltaproteobacteria bacterium]|nr:hypothetical protein [Deltaproteobacteria bacterium]
MTINLAGMIPVAPAAPHGALAAARLPFIRGNDAAGLQAAATQLGFQAVAPNQYVHPADGSWVAMTNGRLDRGYQTNVFRGKPVDLTTLPVGAPGAFGGVASTQVPVTHLSPATLPQLQTMLTRLGFVQLDPAVQYFGHPDQSWVAIIDGVQVLRGFQLQRLDPTDGQQAAAPQVPPTPAPATPSPADGATPAPADNTAAAAPPPPPPPPAFTADAVATYPRVAPAFADGFLACANLPFLQPQNLPNDRGTFLGLGFAEQAPGYFEHADGSWLAYTSQGRIERGRAQSTFANVPVAPGRMGPVAPTFQDLSLAVSQPNIATLAAAALAADPAILTGAGFTAVHPGFYQHPDGSFVATVAGAVHFGKGAQRFASPPSFANLPVAPVDINALHQTLPLWSMPSDPAGAKAHLAAAGFAETRPGFFQSQQLWVAIEGNQIHCGQSGYRYQTPPTLAALPQIASSVAHSWLAIAKTGQVDPADPNLQQTLGNLGFGSPTAGLFTHGDGSWLAVTGGQITRGHQGSVFCDVPQPPAPGQFQQYTAIPPGTWWDWANTHRFACARMPVFQGAFTQQEAATMMTHLGFVQTAPGQWQHPDGSALTITNEPYPRHVATKFQGFDFQQFPYGRNNGARDWNTMNAEINIWRQWLANPTGVTPPWPKF